MSSHVKATCLVAATLLPIHSGLAQTAIDCLKEGREHRLAGECREAIECHKKAIELDPFNACAYHNQGRCLQDLKNYPEALACYDKSIDLVCLHVDSVYAARAQLHLRKGDFEKAIADADVAIAMMKEDAPKRYDTRGRALYQQGKLQLAHDDFTEALKLSPTFFSSLVFRARTNLKLGRKKDALSDLIRAHQLLGTHKGLEIHILFSITWIVVPCVILLKHRIPDWYRAQSEKQYAPFIKMRICSEEFAQKCVRFETGKGGTMLLVGLWIALVGALFFIFTIPLFIA